VSQQCRNAANARAHLHRHRFERRRPIRLQWYLLEPQHHRSVCVSFRRRCLTCEHPSAWHSNQQEYQLRLRYARHHYRLRQQWLLRRACYSLALKARQLCHRQLNYDWICRRLGCRHSFPPNLCETYARQHSNDVRSQQTVAQFNTNARFAHKRHERKRFSTVARSRVPVTFENSRVETCVCIVLPQTKTVLVAVE
jgi:hypothetical protein